jgi:hypothetical protein
LGSSVNVVTEEKVIEACNVTTFARSFPNVKEPHQVVIISVNVSEYLDRGFKVTFNQDRLGCKNLLNLCDQIKNLLFFNWERLKDCFCSLAFLGLKQIFDKDRVK